MTVFCQQSKELRRGPQVSRRGLQGFRGPQSRKRCSRSKARSVFFYKNIVIDTYKFRDLLNDYGIPYLYLGPIQGNHFVAKAIYKWQ